MVTRSYRYRIYPNAAQRDLLARSFGCARFVWNQLLEKTQNEYRAWELDNRLPKPKISSNNFVRAVTALKKEYPWLYDTLNVNLQQSAIDLGTAFSNFFRNAKKGKKGKEMGFPKFKKRTNRNSIRFTRECITVKGDHFRTFRSLGAYKVKWDRELPCNPSSCTITQEPSGEYYVSFVCEVGIKATKGDGVLGIDLGLTDFAVTSDGDRIVNPRFLNRAQKKLTRLQRQLSRKEPGSKNRNKARIKIAKCHRDIRHSRNDFLHKLTRRLVNENQVIGIESLNVKGMTKNRSLAKQISSVAWVTFTRFLIDKAELSGNCSIVAMHPFYPSTHLCSNTGIKLDRKLQLGERKWDCPFCHQVHDRDYNAAMNIKNHALSTSKIFQKSFSLLAPLVLD